MFVRLDKYLCDMGCGSRSDVKSEIKKGAALVNGCIVKASDTKIDTSKDSVFYCGKEIKYLEYEYFMLNKPAGVISATEDKHDKTVLDIIDAKSRKDLFPVGRLDKDTEGLLLITNDGALAHELLSPKKHVDKTYYVETDGFLKPEYKDIFKNGIELEEGFVTKEAELEILEASSGFSKALLTIREGKFHQVKRMMAAVDNTVTYLKRLSMGPLQLPEDLAVGSYRKLTDKEIQSLKGI